MEYFNKKYLNILSFLLKNLKFENIYSNEINKISLVTSIMKYEDAANIDEFAGKVVLRVGDVT